MAGRQEFMALFHSQEWPGLDEILAGLNRLLEEDYQFLEGTYAPGLAKFLSQRMWRMEPRRPKPSASAQNGAPSRAQEPRKTFDQLRNEGNRQACINVLNEIAAHQGMDSQEDAYELSDEQWRAEAAEA